MFFAEEETAPRVEKTVKNRLFSLPFMIVLRTTASLMSLKPLIKE